MGAWASVWVHGLVPGTWVVMVHVLVHGCVLLDGWC